MLEELPGVAVQVGAATIRALNEPVKDAKRAIILVFKNESTNSTIQYVNHEINEGIITETPGLNKLFGLDEDFVVKAQETGNVRPIVKQCHTIHYREQWNIQGRHGDGSFKLKKSSFSNISMFLIALSTRASGQGSLYFSRISFSKDPALTPTLIEQL